MQAVTIVPCSCHVFATDTQISSIVFVQPKFTGEGYLKFKEAQQTISDKNLYLSITFPPEGDALVGGVATELRARAVGLASPAVVSQRVVLWAHARVTATWPQQTQCGAASLLHTWVRINCKQHNNNQLLLTFKIILGLFLHDPFTHITPVQFNKSLFIYEHHVSYIVLMCKLMNY